MDVTGRVILKRNEEIRLLRGHLWVFSNETEMVDETIGNGDFVEILNSREETIGYGFYCRNSLIAVRVASSAPIINLHAWLKERINRAISRRKQYFNGDIYRAVFSESDYVPGLIIDRFNSTVVIESMTYWIDRYIGEITKVVLELLNPLCVLEKSESSWRAVEGLERRKGVLYGEYVPEIIELHGIRYKPDLLSGQKTGFYLDQVANRTHVRKYTAGGSVLDCFCNDGGFALNAAYAGAKSITGIDSSSHAIKIATTNAVLNNVSDRCRWINSDVFDELRRMKGDGEEYDVVIVDPPPFVKSRHKLATALKGYQKLNEYAFDVLKDGGILVTCTCSHHVTLPLFLDMLQRASGRRNRSIVIHEIHGAGIDHPVLLPMPETRYLICLVGTIVSR